MSDLVEDAVSGRIGRVQQVYFRLVVGLACFMVIALVAVMGVQVFFRYVLNDSLIWAEEICRYILIWMTFLFAGAAFQRGELVSLEIIVGKMPGLSRLVFIVPAYLMTLALLGALVWYGWKFATINSFQTIPAIDFIYSAFVGGNSEAGVSIFWVYVAVPIGMAIMFVHMALSLVAQIGRAARGEPPVTMASVIVEAAATSEERRD